MTGNGQTPGRGRSRTRISRVCSACVRGTGVDGGGVSVFSDHGIAVLVHASDAVSRRLDDLQFTLGQGPSVDAASTGLPVLVPDLADTDDEQTDRWPAFLAEVGDTGARALFAFPIRVGDIALGTLDLYRRSPGALDPGQVAIGLTAVEEVGSSLLAPESSDGQTYPLTVHRAAGMVMVQLGSSIEEALIRLRATAFAEGTPVTSVATDVLDGRRRFAKEAT